MTTENFVIRVIQSIDVDDAWDVVMELTQLSGLGEISRSTWGIFRTGTSTLIP